MHTALLGGGPRDDWIIPVRIYKMDRRRAAPVVDMLNILLRDRSESAFHFILRWARTGLDGAVVRRRDGYRGCRWVAIESETETNTPKILVRSQPSTREKRSGRWIQRRTSPIHRDG